MLTQDLSNIVFPIFAETPEWIKNLQLLKAALVIEKAKLKQVFSIPYTALTLLASKVDLCHQPEDEDDEDEERSFEEGLLEKISSKPSTSNTDWSRRWWLPVRLPHVGSRQNLVILVVTIIFVLTLAFAVILWFEMGNISIDSLVAVQVVYVDFFAVVTLLLGGALAVYGLLLFLKMRRVRSERASSEISKVAGLAAVSVVCFTSSALVAILTNIPVSIQWQRQYHIYGAYTSILQITYYFIVDLELVFSHQIGGSAPSSLPWPTWTSLWHLTLLEGDGGT
ncbi:tobamovirus multiplication protein 1-like isoform X3 [Cucumis melo var. makuwa]|uniref:Tobamovirus multiplication protein 1-like isoform X3 n=1 Tax=Cucumis melo var. makuwa TaxID=1194695 RepID=A0A5D3DB12_CUCMM|nr:tobamovirus multiplication protein 1-like isoform X3 [Cucumis melo var. makuwa]TYK20649.1 tobamovirus multiplication protein 1-like isoform X3 [Cucumis melo var. makuwa]